MYYMSKQVKLHFPVFSSFMIMTLSAIGTRITLKHAFLITCLYII